jgi:hypothetical protein
MGKKMKYLAENIEFIERRVLKSKQILKALESRLSESAEDDDIDTPIGVFKWDYIRAALRSHEYAGNRFRIPFIKHMKQQQRKEN